MSKNSKEFFKVLNNVKEDDFKFTELDTKNYDAKALKLTYDDYIRMSKRDLERLNQELKYTTDQEVKEDLLVKIRLIKRSIELARPDDFYTVWKSKVLQNWKFLVSTDIIHGLYWEVTYNGDKKESYVDRYIKDENTLVPDKY